jgi:pyruvyltransferase
MSDTNNLNNIYTLKSNNFGDGVNKIFWEYIIGENITNNPLEMHYITTGSIMCLVNDKSIILGTGFISENGDLGGGNFKSNSNKKNCNPYKIISVRGPLSRQKILDFGIECPEKYGDPLILLPCMYNNYKKVDKDIVGILPHYVDKNNNNYKLLKRKLENNGFTVKFIDIEVGDNYKKIINDVILGIIYKKKTIFLEFSNRVIGNCFKFKDFFKSINVEYQNINNYDTSILDNIIDVKYENIKSLGKELISILPFINEERKIFLTDKFINFYN